MTVATGIQLWKQAPWGEVLAQCQAQSMPPVAPLALPEWHSFRETVLKCDRQLQQSAGARLSYLDEQSNALAPNPQFSDFPTEKILSDMFNLDFNSPPTGSEHGRLLQFLATLNQKVPPIAFIWANVTLATALSPILSAEVNEISNALVGHGLETDINWASGAEYLIKSAYAFAGGTIVGGVTAWNQWSGQLSQWVEQIPRQEKGFFGKFWDGVQSYLNPQKPVSIRARYLTPKEILTKYLKVMGKMGLVGLKLELQKDLGENVWAELTKTGLDLLVQFAFFFTFVWLRDQVAPDSQGSQEQLSALQKLASQIVNGGLMSLGMVVTANFIEKSWKDYPFLIQILRSIPVGLVFFTLSSAIDNPALYSGPFSQFSSQLGIVLLLSLLFKQVLKPGHQ